MEVVKSIADVRKYRAQQSGYVGFVPTMGALHEGHISLARIARQHSDSLWVSIFVNPTQFGPNEDFARYPRTLDEDLDMLREAGVDGVFCPEPDEMYPPMVPPVEMDVPVLTNDLEGAIRPGHFAGVCRVVLKLLNIVKPTGAFFGQKDLQQLRVIQAMVADVNLDCDIVGCPTIREADGLAMSSRNRYLSEEQRTHALGLFKALSEAKVMIEDHQAVDPGAVEAAMKLIIKAHHMETDYAVIRHPRTLGKIDSIEPKLTGGVAAVVAARLGEVRLIDNMLLGGAMA